MRILYITSYYKPAFVYGGPVRSISQMCEALAHLGEEVTVITTNAGGIRVLDVPVGTPQLVDGVQVLYFPLVPLMPRSYFYSPAQIHACVEQIPHYDLVVLETLWTHPMHASVSACRKTCVPYVIPLRGQLMPWALAQKALKKKIYLTLFVRRYLNHAAALHCTDPTEAVATQTLNLTSPVFVLSNGVDAKRFSNLPERGRLRRLVGIAPEDKVLLFLGRLKSIKRPDIAINALTEAQTVQPTHLILAGPDEDNLTPALLSLARRNGCADRVHFTGLLKGTEILSAFADADLLLMPSEVQESFGMSALEALAAGLPIIVSEGVPVGLWAEHAGAGRKIPATADAFARVTREMLADPEQLKVMSKRGKQLVQQQFDLPILARQMLEQFQAIVNTGKPLGNLANAQLSNYHFLGVD